MISVNIKIQKTKLVCTDYTNKLNYCLDPKGGGGYEKNWTCWRHRTGINGYVL